MTPDSWSTGVAANVLGPWSLGANGGRIAVDERPGHHPDHTFRETLSMGLELGGIQLREAVLNHGDVTCIIVLCYITMIHHMV